MFVSDAADAAAVVVNYTASRGVMGLVTDESSGGRAARRERRLYVVDGQVWLLSMQEYVRAAPGGNPRLAYISTTAGRDERWVRVWEQREYMRQRLERRRAAARRAEGERGGEREEEEETEKEVESRRDYSTIMERVGRRVAWGYAEASAFLGRVRRRIGA